jgi:MYXO-CTERM domain-containing protein
MDGVYNTGLWLTNSGTADAWITFKADQCATPIIEGAGAGPQEDVQDSGIGSSEAEYIRFQGLVSRGWNIGFGNGWAGGVDSDEESNGHWEIENCIAYSNGRTGFTFFSAENFTLKHSISAHNGSSQLHAWSSGVTLFEAHGTNIVEGNISFENTDAERNTDGSGFIVDEESNNATFANNIAFGNGGSCLRLTDSSGTRFFNNTCYHNSQLGSRATGPSNPSELYFTNAGVTVQNVSFLNNVIVGTGQAPAGAMAVVNQPQSGWSNNVVATGTAAYFADPEGTNPDFSVVDGDTTLIGKGASDSGIPTDDIGFDPKCIVKRTPVMVGQVATESWWKYDIDIEYIQSIGGVAACFNPGARSGTPDIGAYRAGDFTTVTPGSCIPPEIPEPTDGAGGASTTGSTTTAATDGAAGAMTDGNVDGSSVTGTVTGTVTTTTGGTSTGAGGAASVTGGATAGSTTGTTGAVPTTSTSAGVGGASGVATTASPTTSGGVIGGSTDGGSPGADDDGGCGCRVAPTPGAQRSLPAAGALALGLVLAARRRRGAVRPTRS